MRLKTMVKRLPVVQTLTQIEGNPRFCMLTEPLWVIPFNLYFPFATVYMAALLLTDRQIGIVASVFMFFRAVAAIFSGAITDKLGRKLTTFIFDIIAWSIPSLLWAFSQNFWWFVVAASLNGMMQVTDNSWICLLVEDIKKGSMVKVFSLLHTMAQLAVIFAPLAALMVNRLSVVPAMRILYLFTFVSMTLKFIILYRYCDETEVGKTRMRETQGMSLWKIMSGYGEIYKRIFSSNAMILALTLTTIFNILNMVIGNFFGLYVTGTLLVPEYYLAYFPILRSLVIAFFLFFIQPKLERFGFRYPMLIGLLIYLTSVSILVLTPTGALYLPISSLHILVLSIFLDAIAYSFIAPRNDSLTQLLIEPAERARIRGLMMVIVLGVSIPFGYIAGWLSDTDRRLPFALCSIFIVLLIIIIASSKKRLDAIHKSNEA